MVRGATGVVCVRGDRAVGGMSDVLSASADGWAGHIAISCNHLSCVNFQALSSVCDSSSLCLVFSSSFFSLIMTTLTVGSSSIDRSWLLLGNWYCLSSSIWD